ncbi:rRNA processing/ribosome biogenesis-domain-containing protein [Gloeopeniophorella convolvens]|nr:rRNA processing/ribosome biogenesis-domain-containing protein [Gloeopeniophorella convolvens]
MSEVHPLKTFLQLHLASDGAAVVNLPNVIQLLSSQHLRPSSHTQKWSTRLNSLIHSKDPGARWAGLSLACQTAILSQALMLENAKSWVGAALSLFSKQEPVPILKAAARLLTCIFLAATEFPELQRQIASPNVPKFSTALAVVAEEHLDRDLKLSSITALSDLVLLYPGLHKALHGRLSAFCLRLFNGPPPERSEDESLIRAASYLYSALPVTGGKVAAAGLWKKSVDEVLSIGWGAFLAVRTTFAHDGNIDVESAPPNIPRQNQAFGEDVTLSIPMNLYRLRCVTKALCELLSSAMSRAVQVPLGALVGFVQALLSCTPDGVKPDGHINTSVRAMEEAAIPEIWAFACCLLSRLAVCVKRHLTPHSGQLVNIIVYNLEQAIAPNRAAMLLRTLTSLLINVHVLHQSILPDQITKRLLSLLTAFLPVQSDMRTVSGSTAGSKSRKSRKRAHDYEGDELLKVATDVECRSLADREAVLAAIDVLQVHLHNPYLAPAIHSLASRVIIGLNLSLSLLDPAQISQDLKFHADILHRLQVLSLDLGAGTRNAMSKGLALTIHELREPPHIPGAISSSAQRELDKLLHPRVPPLVRSIPHVETLSLFQAEESADERQARENLRIGTVAYSTGAQSDSVAQLDSIDAIPLVTSSSVSTAIAIVPNPVVPTEVTTWVDSSAPTPPASRQPQQVDSRRHALAHTYEPKISPAPPPSRSQETSSPGPSPIVAPLQPHDITASVMGVSADAPTKPRLELAPEGTDPMVEDEEDEEMPSIDMGSDSD